MYQIISDGACDLGTELAENLNIKIVPFYVSLDGNKHQKEIIEIKVRDFYEYLVANPDVFPKTSMPAIQDYLDVFREALAAGKDIICTCLTAKFSGSYNSAMAARDIILEENPEARITVIDSTLNTVTFGLLLEQMAIMQANNASYEEVVGYVTRVKNSGRIFFTIDSMAYLVKGGRVGKLSGIAANVLGLRPLIIMEDGEIQSGGIVRGRKKSKVRVIEMAINYFKSNKLNPADYAMAIGFGLDYQEALDFQKQITDKLKEAFPDLEFNLPVRQIGATIGVHTGPLPIGVGLIKKFSR